MEKEKHIGYEIHQTDLVLRRFAEQKRAEAGYGDITFAQSGMKSEAKRS